MLARVEAEEADALLAAMEALGLQVESFSCWRDYSTGYIRSVLPAAPETWDDAHRRLELVVRPSFSPEVIIRAWVAGQHSSLQLASVGASIWATHFNPPGWLVGRGDQLEPEEVPHQETASVSSIDDLVGAATRLPEPLRSAGIDGTQIELDVDDGDVALRRNLWSPRASEEPLAHELLVRTLALASESLSEPESQARVQDLRQRLA